MVADLLLNDRFVVATPEEWACMSNAEKDHEPSRKVLGDHEPCTTDRANTHLRTSSGHWCIPKIVPIVLVG